MLERVFGMKCLKIVCVYCVVKHFHNMTICCIASYNSSLFTIYLRPQMCVHTRTHTQTSERENRTLVREVTVNYSLHLARDKLRLSRTIVVLHRPLPAWLGISHNWLTRHSEPTSIAARWRHARPFCRNPFVSPSVCLTQGRRPLAAKLFC